METQIKPSIIPSSDKQYLTGVTVDNLHIILPHLENLLRNAVESSRGRMTYEDVIGHLYKREWQLWVTGIGRQIDACAVTEIVLYKRKKVCNIRICTGQNRQHWQSLMPFLESWAIAQGCTKMESIARKGWAKILKDWETTHIFIEKELIGKPDEQFETTNPDDH